MAQKKATQIGADDELSLEGLGQLLTDEERHTLEERAFKQLSDALTERDPIKAKVAQTVLQEVRRGANKQAMKVVQIDDRVADAVSLMAKSEFAIPSRLEPYAGILKRSRKTSD